MNLENLLITEKYRPKKLEDMILPDRIKSIFKNGITDNYIFYGHFGTGKTSLARILIGTYSKDKAFLELNSSYFTSIEVLRNEVDNFCRTVPMFETTDDIKYVFLDNFDTLNKEEEKSIKINIYKYIQENVLISENSSIEKEDLIFLINKNFPDIRSIIKSVGNFIKTGEKNLTLSVDNKTKLELYNLLYKKGLSYIEAYNFVLEKFGSDNIGDMFKMLGLDFTNWVIENKPEDVNKLFEFNFIISDYSPQLETESDPFILGMTLFGKFKNIIDK